MPSGERGVDVRGRRAAVIGAGGAGSAAVVALAEAGAVDVTVCDADAATADDLARRVGPAYPGCLVRVGQPRPGAADLLVNATPVGMAPDDGLPAELGRLPASLLVIDLIMKPEVTPLLRHAEACGCRAFGGRVMLEGQAQEVAGFFGIGDRA